MRSPPPPRSPWQRLYAGVHRWRRRWWRERAEALPLPTVSVGALHWGGVGKTPLTMALAARLRDRGRGVAVLSRGYRRTSRGPRIVSRGDGPLMSPWEAGDEPHLMATALPGVAVAVAARRARAGRLLLSSLAAPPEVFVLDDGFSHLRLRRDVDVVVLPASDPFGGGRLPPTGRLREPLSAIDRADAVLVSGFDVDDDSATAVADALRRHGFGGRGFACRHRTDSPREVDGGELDPETPCLLVTGVARPERVGRTAERIGVDVRDHLEFPDHHDYPQRSLESIARRCERLDVRVVLTTAKDAAKLTGRLEPLQLDRPGDRRTPVTIAVLPLVAEPDPQFWDWLDGRLAASGDADGDRRC